MIKSLSNLLSQFDVSSKTSANKIYKYNRGLNKKFYLRNRCVSKYLNFVKICSSLRIYKKYACKEMFDCLLLNFLIYFINIFD